MEVIQAQNQEQKTENIQNKSRIGTPNLTRENSPQCESEKIHRMTKSPLSPKTEVQRSLTNYKF